MAWNVLILGGGFGGLAGQDASEAGRQERVGAAGVGLHD